MSLLQEVVLGVSLAASAISLLLSIHANNKAEHVSTINSTNTARLIEKINSNFGELAMDINVMRSALKAPKEAKTAMKKKKK